MKEKGFFRTKEGKVFEYIFYAETSEISAFGPIEKFGGADQRVFEPVEVNSLEEAQRIITEKLGEGTFEDDWV